MLLINLFSSTGCQKPLRASPHKPKLYIAINQVWIIFPRPIMLVSSQFVIRPGDKLENKTLSHLRPRVPGEVVMGRVAGLVEHHILKLGGGQRPALTWPRAHRGAGLLVPRGALRGRGLEIRKAGEVREAAAWKMKTISELPRLWGLIRLRLSLKLISYLFYWTQKHVSFSSWH